ncbi:uncharacterized protein N7500_009521, partial [Penicillium coprophilum]|uniref:uncharacterized protein n=1 Tax=Penicillium coprophilum TaxID=36646 RepID=UPI00238B70DC
AFKNQEISSIRGIARYYNIPRSILRTRLRRISSLSLYYIRNSEPSPLILRNYPSSFNNYY